jgi:pimeloyl-ACP methyl ester carboxylesterase
MTELNFTDQGEGTPILLLHGFPFNKRIWNAFAPELAKSFRVITIDLPGFGGTSIGNAAPSI